MWDRTSVTEVAWDVWTKISYRDQTTFHTVTFMAETTYTLPKHQPAGEQLPRNNCYLIKQVFIFLQWKWAVVDSPCPSLNIDPSTFHAPLSCLTSTLHILQWPSGSPPADTVPTESVNEPTDYPRPTPRQSLTDNEDDQPRKEKRQGYGSHEVEKKMRDGGHRKSNMDTMPTRDSIGGKGGFGGAGRVLQPSGREFAA